MTEGDFQQAFQAHHAVLYRFAYRLTGSASTAEDITQESFLALWRGAARYDAAQGPVRPFLLAIARNLACKHWRREQRWQELDTDAHLAPHQTSGIDAAAAVAQAIQALPPLQREVLILAEYEECTLEEISQIVSAEIGAVKSRLARARDNLRRLLAPYRPTPERQASAQ